MTYAITNGVIYTEDGVISDGYLIVEDGKIKAVETGTYTGDLDVVDAKERHILPGFIDVHIHGGYGEDAMDASYDGLKYLAEHLLTEGTTTFLATTMTQSQEAIEKALQNISAYHQQQDVTNAAEVGGVHLEGPFISEHKIGAQNPAFIQRPTVELLRHFQETANGLIKIVTIAPEVEGASEVIQAMKDEMIFSMGHTEVDFDQANTAAEEGVKHVTHLYNAGVGFHHRNPGMFGAAWTNDQLKTEVIVDGVHSHPQAVAIAYQHKGPEKMFLITDAMRAKGMPEGDYELGGQKVIVKDHEAHLETGSLAGSILKMNDGLRNLIQFTGARLETLWRVASLNQAKALKIDDRKGSIAVGKDADLVIVDDDIQVYQTIKMGRVHNIMQ
ncbi:N-acetylglucosamine-6-phosphate deacetylase [Staphylococcus intermedius]|uniref:N-acetylglucosamine-6-phosphate deacetylase n=1 Tax=Staphylococcus intermedius NCTC 11048 TaxID=1141106 RepID=A0A380G5M3_STAIN|nr:N-acetylglucosamine-6-phosphate deacetylase [Staphylococcus intermedius]PCF64129.1 N-acetylglucosamine-6-phosphate deacetylase [Staphylococcus intermedius]PCF78844.1 N-acetylglucosamine-6-phosphate deacetylase [Staphylococcus intermedius]PCF79817.1 N-acetylglucosamine-6-phosphate deacetylase [Staphylococcus intermedius]PCF85002.1 N-acetylglucosamine-6-phosphate deacetylase [Staphylococcus intermedius]PCF89524.1 N-acetylglucosamine-6-phosphate deacetylase [Staphylococcus intermedius]